MNPFLKVFLVTTIFGFAFIAMFWKGYYKGKSDSQLKSDTSVTKLVIINPDTVTYYLSPKKWQNNQ